MWSTVTYNNKRPQDKDHSGMYKNMTNKFPPEVWQNVAYLFDTARATGGDHVTTFSGLVSQVRWDF